MKDAEEMMGVYKTRNNDNVDDGESSDSDDDDDLGDVPDTREYMPVDVEGLQSINIGGGNSGFNMGDLQNMTMENGEEDDEDEDDEDDEDDIKLQDGDALVVVAKTEEDFASLEINIFDAESSNLYIHHDIPLPSFPLCLALGSVVSSYQSNNVATAGNYVAVGSFEPGIEIWNLDVMNALEPTMVLGGMDTSGAEDDWMRMQSASMGKKNTKKKKGASSSGLREGSHTDAVMGLSWNTVHQQVLASGSADGTVKLWDVTQTKGGYVRPSATLTHHTDKVQSLAWHPSEGTLLATGGYDRRVCLVDARSAAAVSSTKANQSVKKAKLLADCEAIAWDPHNPNYLTAASEDGVVQCWDVRKFGADPVWSFVAHEYGGVSDISYNSQVPGMLMTCSIDKTVALWDTQNASSPTPQPCGSKDMNVGKLYSVSCYPSSPWLLACGGSGHELAIWDMESEDAIQKRFASRVNDGDGAAATAAANNDDGADEPDFEAIMAAEDNAATSKALDGMSKSKKKKGKKKGKAHSKRK
eukprot:CAMPEP_0172308560 /NCGR_PEP_ID=MMETSP1058-20130122/9112_1 /TAXON_ID=83371 /ORGANISM="Detonula confervacea, Strain CCMP 353" /LENGTH=526 /DNA_ID=CAMNT_0013020999 /DNA_START=383 /DNA_END=1964 /DNA_ORIENTATION=+